MLVFGICCCSHYFAGPVGACPDDSQHRHLRSVDTTTDDTEPKRDLQSTEAEVAQDKPFRVGSHQWENFNAFVKSGARCQTADLSTTELEQDRLAMAELRIAGLGADQGRAETITIATYWHTIRSSTGGGALSSQMITDSMTVLNEAFASSGFQFDLKRTDETINDEWFKAEPGSTSDEMIAALHIGTMAALNVYSNSPGEGLLGFATFPSENLGDKDGVVILHSSVPGGSAVPYNEGDTLVHEVSMFVRGLLFYVVGQLIFFFR